MSNAARLFFASGLSLLGGAALGAYVTRVIYGEQTPIDPMPVREKVCPPVKECPPCPPPPECPTAAAVATSTRARPALAPSETEEPAKERKPGLPATAIQLASREVREQLTGCLDEAAKAGTHGIVLLDLTVTATGGQGFISEASVLERSADAKDTAAAESCLVQSARHTRFAVSVDDGEAHFRLPVRLHRD